MWNSRFSDCILDALQAVEKTTGPWYFFAHALLGILEDKKPLNDG